MSLVFRKITKNKIHKKKVHNKKCKTLCPLNHFFLSQMWTMFEEGR